MLFVKQLFTACLFAWFAYCRSNRLLQCLLWASVLVSRQPILVESRIKSKCELDWSR